MSNHINFNDEGLIVDNLQIFLRENECPSLCLSGIYDSATHKSLIRYLKKPNTASVYKVRDFIHNNFTYREEMPPHKLIDGGGILNFDNDCTPSRIIYRTKPTNAYYSNGIKFISEHIEELSQFVATLGWTVSRYSTFGTGSIVNNRIAAEIIIDMTGIQNKFPNRDVLPMINLFEGTYLYNKCFTSSNTFDHYISENSDYKIAVIPCKPGDSFTIAHGYSTACEIAAAYSEGALSSIKKAGHYVEHIVSRLNSSSNGAVNVGKYITYSVPSTSSARYLLVQMPYRDDLTAYQTQTTTIHLGDVNQDGKIDNQDVMMLDKWVSENEKDEPHTIELSKTALIAANVNKDLDLDGNPLVDRNDVTILKAAVESGNPSSLGVIEYEQNVRISSTESDRLLVMYGTDVTDDTLNIPVDEFYISPWAVNSQFIEYFLDRVIQPYSEIEDISWLQTNIRKSVGNYSIKYTGYYDDISDYATTDYIKYNKTNSRYEYYRNNRYLGCYVESKDNFKNGEIIDAHSKEVIATIVNRNILVDGKFDGRIIGEDLNIYSGDSQYSLREIMRKIQKSINERLTAEGKPKNELLKWTIGYYDIETDKYYRKIINTDIVNKYGAFR